LYQGCMVTKTSHLPIHYFLALLWAHPILHISTIKVNNWVAIAGKAFSRKTNVHRPETGTASPSFLHVSFKVNCEWRKRKHIKIRGCYVFHLLLCSKFPNSSHTVYLWFLRFLEERTVRHTSLTPFGQILSFRPQDSPCYFFLCGGQSDNGTGVTSSTCVFPCQYDSTNAPNSASF